MIKNNFLIKQIIALLICTSTMSTKADLPMANIIRGTLQNIDTSVTVAIKTSEQL